MENQEQEVTVKSLLIEANELIKLVLAGESELGSIELSKQVGQKIWAAAETLGIELD